MAFLYTEGGGRELLFEALDLQFLLPADLASGDASGLTLRFITRVTRAC